MKRPDPTLFDLMDAHGADDGIRQYRASLTPTPDTSKAVDVRQNGNLGPLLVEAATLHAEIRVLLTAVRARRPIPYVAPEEDAP